MHAVDHSALLTCAERVLCQYWPDDVQSLTDAEIELGVSYELFECDLDQAGEIEQFLCLPPLAQMAAFFEHLQPSRASTAQASCLDEVPACDWVLVWMRYLTSLLRGTAPEGAEQAVALTSFRLQWAILASPADPGRH